MPEYLDLTIARFIDIAESGASYWIATKQKERANSMYDKYIRIINDQTIKLELVERDDVFYLTITKL